MTAKMRKPYSWKATLRGFVLASLALNTLLVLVFVTASPQKSPAAMWTTTIDRAWFKVRPPSQAQLETMHANAASLPAEQCIACHGSMVGSSVKLHKIHLTTELLPGLKCTDCHKKISLQPRSNRFVVRMVDVGFCKKCHSAFPGLQPNSPMKPSDFKADCTTCHSGKAAYRHDAPYLSQVIAPRECPGCHGGRVLPWTPAHEMSNWLQTHGPEALKTGSKACMRCHEQGLQFCNACHKNKPPSHDPRDAWLNQHATVAAADTRACFTCHQPSFCKTCHVNHPADWRATHPAFVKANGATSCVKCHSTSFCSFCHTGLGGPTS
jgi:hypothetical protein